MFDRGVGTALTHFQHVITDAATASTTNHPCKNLCLTDAERAQCVGGQQSCCSVWARGKGEPEGANGWGFQQTAHKACARLSLCSACGCLRTMPRRCVFCISCLCARMPVPLSHVLSLHPFLPLVLQVADMGLSRVLKQHATHRTTRTVGDEGDNRGGKLQACAVVCLTSLRPSCQALF